MYILVDINFCVCGGGGGGGRGMGKMTEDDKKGGGGGYFFYLNRFSTIYPITRFCKKKIIVTHIQG